MKKLKLLFAAFALMLGTAAMWAQDAGTYYIQNVSNGKWLGPGNSWGTQASVLNHPEYWKLAKVSEGVYTLESVVSNGGTNYYLTGEWCDGGATNFTFAAVAGKEKTYTIANGSGGLLTTNGTTVDVSGSDATATVSQWKLVSEAEMAATLDAANVENPADATFLITDHTFGRNNRYVSAWTNEGNCALTGGNSNKHCAEKYHGVYNVYQKLANAPVGCYKFTAQGFYRQDGSDNANLPVIYANTETATFPLKTGSENSMADACASFEQGKYAIEPIFVYIDTKGELTVGTKLETNTSLWCIWDNFQLTYYGDVSVAAVKMKAFVDAYNAAMDEATAFVEGSMFAEAWTALQGAITANTVNLNDPSLTEETLATATANLVAANTAATAAVTAKTIYDSAVTLINGGTNVDLTSLVINAGFEDGNLNGWTSVNGGNVANNNNWAKVGTYFVERWTGNGDTQSHLSNGTLTHDALVLPAGLYTITAKAQNQEQKNGVAGTGYFLYANAEKVEITGTNTYSTTILLEEDKSELVIKFALDGCTGNWISCDDVHLTYVGEDFPAYALVTGKMNAEVAAAQTAAEEAFQANKNVTNYNALTAAITAAQASKEAYTAAATAIANANDLKETHNLASATAYSTFAEAIAALETQYNNNTLSTADANGAGLTLGTVVTGWRAAANSAAVAYMNDGFSLNAFDAALYINTWSTEGESDGSNFKVPFYEYFAGEGNALGQKTWTGQVSGLENGLYSVSAWVRVRSINADTDAANLTGISMNVNGGTAVDVTEGDVVPVQEGKARFQHKVYTAEGYVTDGVLNVNFDIAGNNNIHWLSFKNISYERIGDVPEADADDYAALNDAIEAAEAKTLGFETGEFAPYNNIEAINALAAAETIDQAAVNAKPVVQATTAALTGATWTANDGDVECVYNGNFAEGQESPAANIQQYGWTRTNNWGQFRNDVYGSTTGYYNQPGSLQYGNAGVYTMPLKANTVYNLTFKYASWEADSNNGMTVSVLNAEDGMAAMNFEANKTKYTDGLATQSLVFVTGAAGNYVLTLGNQGNTVITGVSITKAASQVLTISEDGLPSYAPGTYPSVKLDRSIKAGFNTFVVPFSMTQEEVETAFGTGSKVYGVTAYESENDMIRVSSNDGISANTPCILKAANGGSDYTFTDREVAEATPIVAAGEGVSMTGSYAASVEVPGGSFVISGDKLYIVDSEVSLKGTRAYFSVEGGSEARTISLSFDGITGIGVVENGEVKKVITGEIYDLMGRKVKNPSNGIFVVEGKKVVF